MTIHPNTWHYRLYSKYAKASRFKLQHGEVTICDYMKKVLLGAWYAFLMICVGAIVGIGLMQIIGTGIHWFLHDELLWFINDSPDAGPLLLFAYIISILVMLLGLLAGLCVGFILVVMGVIATTDSVQNYIWEGTKSQSLLASWYRAKKEKYCPFVEFEDKE